MHDESIVTVDLILPAAFRPNAAGKVVRTPRDYWAFVPEPLPPALDLGRLAPLVEEASHAVGNHKGAGGQLPNPLMLMRPFLRREAVLSSRIEGTLTSFSDLLFFEAAPDWIAFFLRGVRTQAVDAVRRTEKLLALRRSYRTKALAGGRAAPLTKLVDLLFVRPAISIRGAQQELGVTFRAAQLNIDRLVALDLLEEVTGRERDRIYMAREIAQVAMEDLPDEL